MEMDQEKDQEQSGIPDDAAKAAPSLPDDSAGFVLAERACWHLLEKKAEDLVVLDLRGRSDVCDFFVLASGQSGIQVKALAKHLHNELVSAGHKPKGLEGMNDGRWALLDFFDVVVHVFHTPAREYFQLEKLWGDAPRLDLDLGWYAAGNVAERHPDLNFTVAADSGGTD
ncbi:MAG: ribosome silencing factor [Candidatus Krumholzibacteriota bacterium]